jgi:hypothetical protein
MVLSSAHSGVVVVDVLVVDVTVVVVLVVTVLIVVSVVVVSVVAVSVVVVSGGAHELHLVRSQPAAAQPIKIQNNMSHTTKLINAYTSLQTMFIKGF